MGNSGQKLRGLRVSEGITQLELADEMGVSKVRVSAIESGRNSLTISTWSRYVKSVESLSECKLTAKEKMILI